MRTATVRMKATELLKRAQAADTRESLLALVEAFVKMLTNDKRKKVTPELRAKVLKMATAGAKVAEIEDKLGLSSPTIRKLLK